MPPSRDSDREAAVDGQEVVPRRVCNRTSRSTGARQDVSDASRCSVTVGVAHSKTCRKRLAESIARSEAGRARREATDRRQSEYFAKIMENRDRKRKIAEREEAASSAGGSEVPEAKRGRDGKRTMKTNPRRRSRR